MIPAGVDVKIDGSLVDVKGPKGMLIREMHPAMGIARQEDRLVVTRPSDEKQHRALHGLTRALLQNMVTGVTKGFTRNLELVGVGYRAAKQGNKLVLTVGYAHTVEIDPGDDLSIEVPAPNRISISGIDKERVGALAAKVRAVRPPEPYKGKGIKYDDEVIRRKVGKAGVKGKK
jgi:large subunit ribosomal protein L6